MAFLRRTHGPSSPRPIISSAGGDAIAGLGAVLALATSVAALVAEAWPAVGVGMAATAVATLAYRRSRQTVLTDVELDELRAAEEALSTAPDAERAARILATAARHLLGAAECTVFINGVGPPVRVVSGGTHPAVEGEYGPDGRVRLLHHGSTSFGSVAVSERFDGARYSTRHERILDVLADRTSATLRQLALVDDVETERQTLADLVSSSSEGIFSVDPNQEVLAWNPAMAGITGVSPEIAVGAPLHHSFAPRTATGHEWPGPAEAPDDTLAKAELLSIDRGGELRWLSCTCARLRRGGHVVIVRDDTEQRKVAADKQGWIAQVSHELRTPLTPIKGFLRALIRRNDTLTAPERLEILTVMMREEQRLEDLVNSLLQSSRLDEATLVLTVAPQDWALIVEGQVELYRSQDPSRTIECRIEPDLRPVMVDATVGAGVLANLLSNAIKYGDGPIEVTVEADAGEAVTSVIDHGPGIPVSDRDRVFDRFTRLGDHLTRRTQGVGLGLHIARESVARLDGQMWIDETPGGGTTFRFTLPMARMKETSG